MSASFVAQLRTRGKPIELEKPDPGTITVRVEVAEVWDTVRVVARPQTAVGILKERIVADFFPDHQYLEEFVLKLRGWEVLDERASLSEAGVVDGSILLLAYRRRRAVK